MTLQWDGVTSLMESLGSALGRIVFPEDCRLCERPLQRLSRIPVCEDCLHSPAPLAAEFFCRRCRTPFANAFPLDESGLCALCRHEARGYDAAYSFGAYEGALRGLIHSFKYGRIRTLARPLAGFLLTAYPRDQRFDAIVPMPLHWRRFWKRGFNQSAMLARELSRKTGVPLLAAVRRRRATPPQAGLSNAQRRANVAGCFETSQRQAVRGLRLLLIDDVMTTGATAGACAATLRRAGAAHVAVLTLARADRAFPRVLP